MLLYGAFSHPRNMDVRQMQTERKTRPKVVVSLPPLDVFPYQLFQRTLCCGTIMMSVQLSRQALPRPWELLLHSLLTSAGKLPPRSRFSSSTEVPRVLEVNQRARLLLRLFNTVLFYLPPDDEKRPITSRTHIQWRR
jgi:hypothetical protein